MKGNRSNTSAVEMRWPFFLVALASLALIVARMRWPALHFDSSSLILFAIAGGCLSLCYLPLKRIKMGELEMELETLQGQIGSARDAYPDRATIAPDVPAQIAELLQKGVDNPEGCSSASAPLSRCARAPGLTRSREILVP